MKAKEYDFYLSMAPDSDGNDYMGELTLLLLQSGLNYCRHIGPKNNFAARRDIGRLIDSSNALLYVSDQANNSLDVAAREVEQAAKQDLEIVVVKVDNSQFPAQVSEALSEATIYDATQPGMRREAFGDAIRRLGGNIPVETDNVPSEKPTPANEPETRPTEPDATPDKPGSPITVAEENENLTSPIKAPLRLSTVIISIILAIIVIAGAIALIF